MGQFTFRRWVFLLPALLLVVACPKPNGGPDGGGNPNNNIPGPPPAGGGGLQNQNFVGNPNACNAFVNNPNIGQPCAISTGIGTWVCVLGTATCQPCMPGQTRESTCPCGLSRLDTCSTQGTWTLGVCTVCSAAVVGLSTCDQADACTPGAVKYQVCDISESDANSIPCVGQQFTCNSGCQWVATSACAAQASQCNQDQSKVSTCGLCGTHTLTCSNGCFWDDTPCLNQGACSAGSSVSAPCTGDGNSCYGGTSTVSCNSQCQWDPNPTCSTCQPGTTRQVGTPCTKYIPNSCGNAYVTQNCVQTPFTACEGTAQQPNFYAWTVASGVPVDTSACEVGSACIPLPPPPPVPGCPTQPCAPGSNSTQSCTTSSNYCSVPGTQTATCNSNGCGVQLSTCVPVQTLACQPGDTKQTACPGCRPGNYKQEVCDNCQWSVKSDPCGTCY